MLADILTNIVHDIVERLARPPHELGPKAWTAASLLQRREDAVLLIRQIVCVWRGVEPLIPAEFTRPPWPRGLPKGQPMDPELAAAYLEAFPEMAGMVALPWADGWRTWANEVETLLHDCGAALEAHARGALASAVEARQVDRLRAAIEAGARRAS